MSGRERKRERSERRTTAKEARKKEARERVARLGRRLRGSRRVCRRTSYECTLPSHLVGCVRLAWRTLCKRKSIHNSEKVLKKGYQCGGTSHKWNSTSHFRSPPSLLSDFLPIHPTKSIG